MRTARNNKSRTAQVTLFVIIGIVILVVLGIVLLRPASKPATEQASKDSARVTEYVQSCLSSSGEDVLRTMGTTGGYLSTDKFKLTQDTRDSQIIEMTPQKIVMWHEIHSCSSNPAGCVANNRPPLCKKDQRNCPVGYAADTSDQAVSIQEQLETGTQAKLKDCLKFGTAFPELDIKERSSPKVTALIREENVQLSLNYPISFTALDSSKVDLDSFSTKLNIRLPDLYRFAMKVQNTEAQATFLENIFLHLHSIYSGSGTQIPPIREVQLYGKDTGYWIQSNVKDVIEEDLLPNMNFIQIINAKNSYTTIESPNADPTYRAYANGAYQYMTIKFDNNVTNYSARLEYPNTPIYLSINNGQATLKPDTFGGAAGDIFGKLAGIRFTQYKFKYNVAFPMVVHLYDPDAFDGKGYQLDFGLEANIRNNHPLNTSINPLTFTSSDPGLDLSDPLQLVNHIYKVSVIDAHTNKPVSKAMVYYDCDNKYYMGETDVNGVWTGKLPYCITGGVLEAQASSYVAQSKDIQNTEEDGMTTQVSLNLWPIMQKNVLIYKRSVADMNSLVASPAGTSYFTYKTPLNGTDVVIISIEKIKESPYEEDVPTVGMLRFGNLTQNADQSVTQGTVQETLARLDEVHAEGGITDDDYNMAVEQLKSSQESLDSGNVTYEPLALNATLDLIPGRYTIDGVMMYGGKVVVPAQERCMKILGQNKCYTMPEKNFTSWVSGGVSLKDQNAVAFSEDDIYSNKTLVLYVAEETVPSNWDQLEQYQDVETYLSYGRYAYVMPTFISTQ